MPKFLSSHVEKVNYITIPEEVGKDDVKEFELLAIDWGKLSVQLHAFDFKQTTKVHASFYNSAVQFRKKLTSQTCKVVSLNVPQNILDQMKAAGVENAMGYLKNFNSLKKTNTEDTPAQARLWLGKYLIDSARNAMSVMFKTTLNAEENFSETIKNMHPERFTQVSFLASEGPVLKANVRLYFEKKILENFVKAGLPSQTPADTETFNSMATELLNVIFSAAKSKLNDDRGYRMPTGIPALITPVQAMTERKGHWRDSRVIPMTTPHGEFFVELEFYS